MAKKILLILLIVCTALSMAIGLTACEEKKGEDESTTAKLEYNLETDDDGSQYYSVSWGDNASEKDVIIPNEYKGLPVKVIKGNKEKHIVVAGKCEIPNSIIKFDYTIDDQRTDFSEINFKGTADEWASIDFGLFQASEGEKILFNGQEVKEITLSVEKIPECAFYRFLSLEKVTLTENVKEVGAGAFSHTALKSLTIPASVIKGHFDDLQDLIFLGKTCEDISLGGKIENLTMSIDLLNCIEELRDTSLLSWCDVNNLIITSGEATTFKGYWVSNCKELKSISLAKGIDNIERFDLYKLDKVTSLSCSIDFYDTITKDDEAKNLSENIENLTIISGNIPEEAFYQNTKLKTVTLKDEVEEIGNSAFSGCTNLVSVSMTDSVTSLGNSAFYNCTNLKTVTLSKGLTEIKQNTFSSCTSLENLVIPSKVEMIGFTAFSDCSSLTNISIPEGNSWVGASFFRCTSLTTVNLPSTITNIYAFAFVDCTALKDINFNGTIEQWNDIIKGSDWDNNSGEYTIHCTNGDIAKDN